MLMLYSNSMSIRKKLVDISCCNKTIVAGLREKLLAEVVTMDLFCSYTLSHIPD